MGYCHRKSVQPDLEIAIILWVKSQIQEEKTHGSAGNAGIWTRVQLFSSQCTTTTLLTTFLQLQNVIKITVASNSITLVIIILAEFLSIDFFRPLNSCTPKPGPMSKSGPRLIDLLLWWLMREVSSEVTDQFLPSTFASPNNRTLTMSTI